MQPCYPDLQFLVVGRALRTAGELALQFRELLLGALVIVDVGGRQPGLVHEEMRVGVVQSRYHELIFGGIESRVLHYPGELGIVEIDAGEHAARTIPRHRHALDDRALGQGVMLADVNPADLG
ncbi:MAG: hypothetical protein BZ138_07115 [Methanosphaera sp. rholeuAM270]|nr:MAG: hypothetical protein BZ138_07115 [Methanosphaera sp. rholeuAM270]